MASSARAQAAGSGAKFLVDAYCGSGLFALSCAPAFARVAGIELSESSIKFATANAAAASKAYRLPIILPFAMLIPLSTAPIASKPYPLFARLLFQLQQLRFEVEDRFFKRQWEQ